MFRRNKQYEFELSAREESLEENGLSDSTQVISSVEEKNNNDFRISIDDQENLAFNKIIIAYKNLLNESVLRSIHYLPSKQSFHKASLNLFCDHQNTFSWSQSGITMGAAAIGITAATFSIGPAGDAAKTFLNFISKKTGKTIPENLIKVLVYLFQIGNTTENAIVSTLTGNAMLTAYFNKISPAEKFLTYHEATCQEKIALTARKIFNILSAITTNIPTYFITYAANLSAQLSNSLSVGIASLTAVSNLGISWYGANNLHFGKEQTHRAWQVLLLYLHEQMDAFLKLPLAKQNQLLHDLSLAPLNKTEDELSDQDKQSIKETIFKLLTLGQWMEDKDNATFSINLADENSAQGESIDDGDLTLNNQNDITHIAPQTTSSVKQKFFANTLGVLSASAELTFSEMAGVNTAHFFKNPSSPVAITSGLITALLAGISCFGFGFNAGKNAGNALLDAKTPLASLYNAKLREASKWFANCFSLFAGATLSTLGYSAATDLSHLLNLKDINDDLAKVFISACCYAGGAVENGYYTLQFVDNLIIYFVSQCADDEMRRLFHFVMETRQFYAILARTAENNYLELLRWMLKTPHDATAIDKELSNLLHSLFATRLTLSQYQELQGSLNSKSIIVKNRDNFLPTPSPTLFQKKHRVKQRKQSQVDLLSPQARY